MNKQSTIDLRTGARMPVLALGTWEPTDDTAETVVHALDVAYRMIACQAYDAPA